MIKFGLLWMCAAVTFLGCALSKGNTGQLQSYPSPALEAEWIRNGEPIEYEQEMWYPKDGTETFIDSEMQFLTDYRGVQVFADKVDVRPYERLYTKFAPNRFRYFMLAQDDDPR